MITTAPTYSPDVYSPSSYMSDFYKDFTYNLLGLGWLE